MKKEIKAHPELIFQQVLKSQSLFDLRSSLHFTAYKAGIKLGKHRGFDSYNEWRRIQTPEQLQIFDKILEDHRHSFENTFWFIDFKNKKRIIDGILLLQTTSQENPTTTHIPYKIFRSGENSPIFIAISPFSYLTDIREFISHQSETLKEMQKAALGAAKKQHLPLPKHSKRLRPNVDRDKLIYSLSLLSIEELQILAEPDFTPFGNVSKRKDILISSALRATGLEVPEGSIRRIINKKGK